MATGRAGPRDEAVRQQWRSARRAVLRAHHPDRGGDPDRMRSELDLVDQRFGVVAGATPPVGDTAHPQVDLRPPGRWQPVARGLRRAGVVVRRGTRTARARLPTGWPGHRRYIDL